ncbi:MAG: hypothetical protein N3G80_02235 [Candidatus Micrarchaeota archaeon]|nr:hypothetical protein [Candidatus Micrarchaeota archaeon]
MPIKKLLEKKIDFLSSQAAAILSKVKIHTNAPVRRGERLEARIELHLSKPIKARKLEASLVCIETERKKTIAEMVIHERAEEKETGIPYQTHMRQRTTIIEKVVFKETKRLDGEKIYQNESYYVDFLLPANAPPTLHHYSPDGKKAKWIFSVQLDVPFAIDVQAKKEVQID